MCPIVALCFQQNTIITTHILKILKIFGVSLRVFVLSNRWIEIHVMTVFIHFMSGLMDLCMYAPYNMRQAESGHQRSTYTAHT